MTREFLFLARPVFEFFFGKFFFSTCVLKRKKENGQPKGGMGGRHAATTQGF